MWVFFTLKAPHVNIYEAKGSMHLVHTCIIIILAFSFFNGTKKLIKVIEDDIYDKLLEINKGIVKFVLTWRYDLKQE